jgi:hypothetical protein
MGNIALRTRQQISENMEQNQLNNSKEANAMILPQYHNGWKLPKV